MQVVHCRFGLLGSLALHWFGIENDFLLAITAAYGRLIGL